MGGEPEKNLIETQENSEPEIIDISLEGFEFMINKAAEDSLDSFLEVQEKYEDKPVRFTATVRGIIEAVRVIEDPGIYTYFLVFEKGTYVTDSTFSFYLLPNTIELLFSVGDEIRVTGEYNDMLWDFDRAYIHFYISDVEFKRE